ncbi:hypothetical protein [Shewanella algae]|uniref:hypothetical protein n=1 Tax=Shewanella algae TaxID=38313 RepID=UPI0031F4DEB9
MSLLTYEDIDSLVHGKATDDINSLFFKNKDHYIRKIWNDKDNIERLRSLRSQKIISDYDLYKLAYYKISSFNPLQSENPLFKLIAEQGSDGTLLISDQSEIHYLCLDAHFNFIKGILDVGGKIDQNKFLTSAFSGYKEEYKIFDYLLGNFDFDSSALSEAAAWLVYNEHYEEELGKAAFKKIVDKGLDINQKFSNESELSEYDYLLSLVFSEQPIVFISWLDGTPSQNTISDFPWEFIIFEHDINEEHVEAIRSLIQKGYELPLQEIATFLRDKDEEDFAESVEHISV